MHPAVPGGRSSAGEETRALIRLAGRRARRASAVLWEFDGLRDPPLARRWAASADLPQNPPGGQDLGRQRHGWR